MAKTLTEYEYMGVNRQVLEKLSREELVELIARADDYTMSYEGFHCLDKKYLMYKKRRVKIRDFHPITMAEFGAALREAYMPTIMNSEFFKPK
jgi:hypothetical protein